jgi:hypothetical protein
MEESPAPSSASAEKAAVGEDGAAAEEEVAAAEAVEATGASEVIQIVMEDGSERTAAAVATADGIELIELPEGAALVEAPTCKKKGGWRRTRRAARR